MEAACDGETHLESAPPKADKVSFPAYRSPAPFASVPGSFLGERGVA